MSNQNQFNEHEHTTTTTVGPDEHRRSESIPEVPQNMQQRKSKKNK